MFINKELIFKLVQKEMEMFLRRKIKKKEVVDLICYKLQFAE